MWHVGHLCVCEVQMSRWPVMSNTRGKDFISPVLFAFCYTLRCHACNWRVFFTIIIIKENSFVIQMLKLGRHWPDNFKMAPIVLVASEAKSLFLLSAGLTLWSQKLAAPKVYTSALPANVILCPCQYNWEQLLELARLSQARRRLE